MRKKWGYLIWFFTFLIIAAGLMILFSASHQNMRVSQKVFYDQFWGAGIGLLLMFVLSQTNYRRFYDFAYLFYIMTVFLLIFVLLGGKYALGAQRWISIAGIRFQPSEIAKLAVILALSRYFSDQRVALTFRLLDVKGALWRDLIIPFLITALPMILIFKQPDLGTAILLFGIFLIMLFVSGLAYNYIFMFLGLCLLVVPFGWHVLKPYQKDRLLVFLNPNIDPLGAGYTIIQSKIAIGSGKILGKGWLAGTQNQLSFLPERHTDFIFSVIGEEWGLLGGLFFLASYFVIIYCGFKIAEQVKDRFGMHIAVGITGIFTLQVVINIGMVLGLCPVVGITLPLVSYGRTSLLIFMFMLGCLLSLGKRRTVF